MMGDLTMKDEVHDKQIAYLMDRTGQLNGRNGWHDRAVTCLMTRINRLSGGNVQQNNVDRFRIGK